MKTLILFTTVALSASANVSAAIFSDANWGSIGGLPGANGPVGAAVVDGSGNLYIGGSFITVGGVNANRIAKWNGTNWSALGSGVNGNVSALAVSGGDLYAGGEFTMAGGSAASRVAKWNGSNWSPLGSGMNSNVWALAVSGSSLFAGGQFTTAGGSAANWIAEWNGSSWSALGSGMGPATNRYGYVAALAVSGSDLYAGGNFTAAGGSTANYIAKWNGSSWSQLGSGMGVLSSPSVSALAVSGSELYAGGAFSTAGGSAAHFIAKWNGSSWSALGSGMGGGDGYPTVSALAVSGSDLYAGGRFTMPGGTWASHIAKWNGSSWSRLGSGMNSTVRALAVSGSDLYAGGSFTTAGGKASAYVARADLDLLTESPFTDVTATVAPGLPQVGHSSVAWGDYDNDGRPDFLLTGTSFYKIYYPYGYSDLGTNSAQLWRNTGSGFTNVTDTVAPGLPQVTGGSVAWADYDSDGRLDFLLTGYTYSGGYNLVSQLWRNTGSGFKNVTATVAPGLPGVSGGSVAWGDYDNDGRVDFLLTGFAGYVQPDWVPIFVSQLWRNTGSGFTNVTDMVAPGLPGVAFGSVAWADFDNDGRLDFLLTGGIRRRSDLDDYTPLRGISQLWRNTGSGFVNVTDTVAPGLPGVFSSAVAWADYDNDGWQDFLLTGFNFGFAGQDVSAFLTFSQLWRNTGNGFVNVTGAVAPGLPQVDEASVAWGDYDNDGRPDFLLTTLSGSQIWRNTGTGFTNVTASVAPGLPPLTDSSVAWGDFDNDGRLDLLLAGAVDSSCDVCDPPPTTSQLWRNQIGGTNPSPAVITGLPTSVSPGSVTLNARINPLGDAASAWFVWGDSTNYGNTTAPQPMGNGTSFINFSETISGLSAGVTYYYRAVGSNEQGRGSFGAELRFTLTPPAVTTSAAGNLTSPSATLNGHINPNNLPASGWFEWGLTPAFGQTTSVRLLSGGLGSPLTLNVSGLEGGRTYYFRAAASNSFGVAYGAMQSFITPTFANVTEAVVPALAQVGHSAAAWGDYDNDGRLDFILTGYFFDAESDADVLVSQLWRNTASGFTNVAATVAPGLPGVQSGLVAWADYDNDGRLDFLLNGYLWEYGISQLWRNAGSGFTNVTASTAPGLPQVIGGSIAWGDYDNDGQPDLLVIGFNDDVGWLSQLWRNTGNGFTDVTTNVEPGLAGVGGSAIAWADYDNDGRLDFLRTGFDSSYVLISQLWRNTGSGFTNVTATVAPNLLGLQLSSVAWADYDNDGRLDFLITGLTNYSYASAISQIWRNTENGFTNVTATVAPGLPGMSAGSAAWGDYDNDGRLDFLLMGYTSNSASKASQIWRNTGGGFENVTAIVAPGLPQLSQGSIAWGDYDNDGRLDFLLTGWGTSGYISQLWRNHHFITNSPPGAPTGLAMTASSNAVMLSWNSATDGQTPASGLTYNVRAGTTPGGNDLLSAHVNATNGFRRVPAMGNAMLRHSLPLTGLTNGQIVYWSVQTVDTAFAGGPFATETSVVSLPELSIARPGATNAVVSWSPPTFGWLLQQSTNLKAGQWTTAPSGNANPATVPATNGAQFYRLRQH